MAIDPPGHRAAPPVIDRRGLLAAALGVVGGGSARAIELPDLIVAVRPSVVAVGTFNALDNPRFTFRGTGFVVGDGTQVVTNHHVLPGPDLPAAARLVVAVPQPGGATPQVRDARLRGDASEVDIAALDIAGSPLPALPLADSTLVRDGEAVVLIGFPLGAVLGLTPVTHRGIVSAVTAIAIPPANSRQLDAKTLSRLRAGPLEIYQLDATAYPGNSGSPLIDAASGKVVGIVNSVFVKGTKESAITAPSGITYAIPVRHIHALLQGR